VKTFKKGDRVRIPQSHWVAKYRGLIGTVYSTSLTAANEPTCYVQFQVTADDGTPYLGSAWELMADLEEAL